MPNKFITANRSIAFVNMLGVGEEFNSPQPVQVDPKAIFANFIDDFYLEKEGLVEKSWGLAERPERNPIYAKFLYENGIFFVAEPNKLVFQDSAPQENVAEKDFYNRALKLASYLEKHDVTLSAIGINYGLLLPHDAPADYIADNFMNKVTVGQITSPIEKAAVQLSYKLQDNVSLNINCFPSSKQNIPNYKYDKEHCVAFDVNFHHQLGAPANLSVQSIISDSEAKLELLKSLISME